ASTEHPLYVPGKGPGHVPTSVIGSITYGTGSSASSSRSSSHLRSRVSDQRAPAGVTFLPWSSRTATGRTLKSESSPFVVKRTDPSALTVGTRRLVERRQRHTRRP